MVDSTATQIDLLFRVGRSDINKAVLQQLLAQPGRILDEHEPVNIQMFPCHATEEEVHRPTAPKPDWCIQFTGCVDQFGDRNQLHLGEVLHQRHPRPSSLHAAELPTLLDSAESPETFPRDVSPGSAPIRQLPSATGATSDTGQNPVALDIGLAR